MDNYLDFKPAKCRDCYRCLRECPVKAIRIVDHQARIIPERCILCGNCTRVCPQNAKTVHTQEEEVRRLLESGADVIASVAPSFISSFRLESFDQIAEVLFLRGRNSGRCGCGNEGIHASDGDGQV